MRSLSILFLSTGDPMQPANTQTLATLINPAPGSALAHGLRVDTTIGG